MSFVIQMVRKGIYYRSHSTGNAKKIHRVHWSSAFYMTLINTVKKGYDDLLQWYGTLINKGVNWVLTWHEFGFIWGLVGFFPLLSDFIYIYTHIYIEYVSRGTSILFNNIKYRFIYFLLFLPLFSDQNQKQARVIIQHWDIPSQVVLLPLNNF